MQKFGHYKLVLLGSLSKPALGCKEQLMNLCRVTFSTGTNFSAIGKVLSAFCYLWYIKYSFLYSFLSQGLTEYLVLQAMVNTLNNFSIVFLMQN